MEILSVAVNDGPVLEVTKPCNDRKKLSGGHYTEAKSMWHEAYLAHFTVHKKNVPLSLLYCDVSV